MNDQGVVEDKCLKPDSIVAKGSASPPSYPYGDIFTAYDSGSFEAFRDLASKLGRRGAVLGEKFLKLVSGLCKATRSTKVCFYKELFFCS